MGEKLTNIDWAEIAKSQLIPPGVYIARMDKVEARTSEKGNPYWNIEFTIVQPEELLGRKLWDVFMLETQNLWKIRNLAGCVGIDLSSMRDFDSDELLQQTVVVHVQHDVYEGVERNRIKKYSSVADLEPPSEPPSAPPEQTG